MDLLPLALIHMGVSIALAAHLILVYKRIYKADFLVYWAAFWLCIAFSLGTNQVAVPLLSGFSGAATILIGVTVSMFLVFPTLMVCAAMSIRGGIRQRTAWWLVLAALGLGCVIAFWRVGAGVERLSEGAAMVRSLMTGLALLYFTYRLAIEGRQEIGSAHPALVIVSALYTAHNYVMALSPLGLNIYPNAIYSSSDATAGILLQFGTTLTLSYYAIEKASKASAEALEAGRRLHALLENVGVAGLIVGRDERVTFCNSWLTDALGLSAGEINGSSWIERFVPQPERDAVRKVFQSGLDRGQWPAVHEYSLESSKGRRFDLRWYHTSLRDSSGEIVGAASLGIDLSQQKRLESQVQQAQKMETLGRLAGGVAHDFNNHLTAINGFADLLIEDFATNETARTRLSHIRRSGELASTLTQQLLTFSRQRAVEPQSVCVNDIVHNCAGILRRLVRENVELETNLSQYQDYILADPGQIDHVVLNLVLNANDAISGSGVIHIRTGRFGGRPPVGSAASEGTAKEFVTLEVEDNGVGIDDWNRDKVFEPFFTTKAEGRGTGLGLASAYGTISQAGGWIDVKSQVGKGSVFTVYLPRVERAQAGGSNTKEADKKTPSYTILLVEDQDMVRTFATLALEAAGHRVFSASGGNEARRIAAESDASFDALATDVVMPGMSGIQLAHELRKNRPGLATLFVSGYTFEHYENLNESLAPHDFLSKPFTGRALCERVATLVAESKGKPRKVTAFRARSGTST